VILCWLDRPKACSTASQSLGCSDEKKRKDFFCYCSIFVCI
jgi:hypothetical protein